MRVFLIVVATLVSSAAHAQVYRCDVDGRRVFSDRPCAQNAEIVRAVGGSVGGGGEGSPADRGRALCETQTIANMTGLYDPGSAVIESIQGGKADTVDIAGSLVMARAYIVRVNAKNRMGGYVGAQPVICHSSLDGYRLLKVDTALVR